MRTVMSSVVTPHRRRPRIRAGLVALVAVITGLSTAACGSDDGMGTAGDTVTVTDGAGRKVTVEVPVTKVAVFNAANAELVRAVGGAETIVGLDSASMDESMDGYWPGFDESMSIGAGQTEPNYEKITRLDPDVVLFPSNGAWREAVEKLEPFGIDVLVVTGWDLPPLFDNIRLLGTILGKQGEAGKFAGFCSAQREMLRERLRGEEKPAVYLENQADYSTVVEGAGWDAMLTDGGGRNVFTSLEDADEDAANVNAVEVSPEAILDARPEYVIRIVDGGFVGTKPGTLESTIASLTSRAGWPELPAVRNGNVIVTENRWLNGCSKILGSVAVASWLHPDAMKGVDPESLERRYLQEFQDIEPTSITQFLRSGS